MSASDIERRANWYMFIRFLLLMAIIVPGLTTLVLLEGFSKQTRADMAIAVIAVGGNLLFYGLMRLRRASRYLQILCAALIAIDVLLIGIFVFGGGISSTSGRTLFVVPILIAAALFGRQGIYAVTTWCITVYFGFIGAELGSESLSLAISNRLFFFPALLVVIAIAIDFITSLLNEKQAKLRETVQALERAQEVARVGSWNWDIDRDEITWSKQMFRLYGMKPSESKLSYKQYLQMHRNNRQTEAHQKIIMEAMENKSNFVVDHQITLPNGQTKHLHGEGRPWVDDKGHVYRMTGTSQDVTDIYHLDEAKREFVSLASHQLRTPASGVKAFLSLLEDGHAGPLSDMQRKFVRQATDANDRQLEVIDNLLSLASIESGKLSIKKELVDIREVIARSIRDHGHQAQRKKQRITYRRPRSAQIVLVDPIAFQMALDNLISNALKYSPEKKSVVVASESGQRITTLTVKDSGIGITRKNIPLLFHKFSRIHDVASKTVGGSGLGLYTAKHIVELHGGTIRVKSSRKTGTIFTIKLPTPKRVQ